MRAQTDRRMNDGITIGIDNGSSGSVAVLHEVPGAATFQPVPTQDYLHYGKKGSIGRRLDRAALRDLLMGPGFARRARVYVERPFSGRFINAVVPAHRFFEATIIVLEDLGLGYEVIDSGTWQKPLLGNVSGSPALKLASRLRGVQLYPHLKDAITRHGDADGLLIAHHFHYARH
jgi:hypothetical protein